MSNAPAIAAPAVAVATPRPAPRDLLALEVDKFITLDQSRAFHDAQKLVAKHTALLVHIKAAMKKQGITEKTVDHHGSARTLRFNIKEREVVNTHALPDDIKLQYSDVMDMWYRQVICDDVVMMEEREAISD